MNIIKIGSLFHAFKLGSSEFPVLKGIDLEIGKGEFVTLLGKSGSGKSTLLNLIGGLMKPSAGKVELFGKDITTFTENQLAEFRKAKLGFIFQSYNLIPTLNTFENVELPLVFKGVIPEERQKIVIDVLEMVGLADHKEHMPGELSGGQQQRVSIARALVTNPELVLADEPTGNLDSQTEAEVLAFIKMLNQEQGITFVVVTHDDQVAAVSDRVILLKDGLIVSDKLNKGPEGRRAV